MTPQKTSPLENLRRAVERHRADELDRKLGPVATALVAEAFRRQEEIARTPLEAPTRS